MGCRKSGDWILPGLIYLRKKPPHQTGWSGLGIIELVKHKIHFFNFHAYLHKSLDKALNVVLGSKSEENEDCIRDLYCSRFSCLQEFSSTTAQLAAQGDGNGDVVPVLFQPTCMLSKSVSAAPDGLVRWLHVLFKPQSVPGDMHENMRHGTFGRDRWRHVWVTILSSRLAEKCVVPGLLERIIWH